MKKTLCFFAFLLIIITAASVSAQVLDAPMWDEATELNPNDLKTYRDMVWKTWKEDMMEDETLLMETSELTLEFGDVQMHYFIYTADGDKLEDGYPLYIALHGGGASQKNDSQWDAMKSYYLENLEVGMYVAPRGVRDTWDTHFNPESYPLYDRLIEYMILTEGELDVMIHPEYEWLNFTTMDRSDPNYQFEAAVSYQWLVEQL